MSRNKRENCPRRLTAVDLSLRHSCSPIEQILSVHAITMHLFQLKSLIDLRNLRSKNYANQIIVGLKSSTYSSSKLKCTKMTCNCE